MPALENAIPLRWPSGALEIAKRAKAEGFTPQTRQALERLHDPAALDCLQGSPVDCLVVSWAAGLPEDAAQQQTARPLIDAARRRGLEVVGFVEGSANHGAAVASAKAAGLTAAAISGFKGKADLPVIPWGERPDVPWDAAGPVLAISGNVWPGVSMPARGADAGPTGTPWLDSNGWFIQMARARVARPLWLLYDPPGKGRVLAAQDYANAVCDAETSGARWVVSFDNSLLAGLAERSDAARAALAQVGAAATFYRDHAAWKSWRSLGVMGVISDFTGADLDLSGEILNLAARRNLFFRVLWKQQAASAPFTGLKALVYTDAAPPPDALRRKMMAFAEQGGLLITGPKWGAAGTPAPPDFNTQFDLRAVGKGRLAVARGDIADAYQAVVDIQFLVSRANDLFKIYNSSSSGCATFTAAPDGRRAALQVLSYAGGFGGGRSSARTLWVNERYRTARLWAIGAAAPTPLDPIPSEEYFGVEYQIPPAVPGTFAVEFEA
jgi:hypothetical protein